MLKIAVHKVGTPWNNLDNKDVVRVRAVSKEAIADGSPDGLVITTSPLDVGGRCSNEVQDSEREMLKVILFPESAEEVDGLIRQLGELKSRMLKRERKQHTIFGG